MQTVVSQTSPPKKSFLYDPKVRGVFYQVVLVAVDRLPVLCGGDERHREPAARQDRLRLRLPEQHGRLRHQPDADPVQRGRRRPMAMPSSSACSTPCSSRPSASSSRPSSASSIGIARLSKNWMVAKVAMVYVEVLRNIPLLVQLLFWYIAVLGPLPQPRNSLEIRRRLLPEFPRPLHGHAALAPRYLDPRHAFS